MIPVPIVRSRAARRRLLVVAIALLAAERGTTPTSAFVAVPRCNCFGTNNHPLADAFAVSRSALDASLAKDTQTRIAGDSDRDSDRDSDNDSDSDGNPSAVRLHTVQGVRCREVVNELPVVGRVVVLEATADAQEELVDECLELEDEKTNDKPSRIAEGDPYGAVLWPAAWAVSNYLLSEPDLRDNLSSLSILELGTGTGLVSIAAAMGGAKRVIATDYEPLALDLTRYAASEAVNTNNNTINGITNTIETRLLDMCALDTQPLPLASNGNDIDVDVVVAADIMYEPKTGIAMAHRAIEALRQNCRVIIGDSPGRPGRPAFLKTLRELGIDEDIDFVETIGKTCSGPRHDLICGKGSTSVSETPQELSVTLLDLKPAMLRD